MKQDGQTKQDNRKWPNKYGQQKWTNKNGQRKMDKRRLTIEDEQNKKNKRTHTIRKTFTNADGQTKMDN